MTATTNRTQQKETAGNKMPRTRKDGASSNAAGTTELAKSGTASAKTNARSGIAGPPQRPTACTTERKRPRENDGSDGSKEGGRAPAEENEGVSVKRRFALREHARKRPGAYDENPRRRVKRKTANRLAPVRTIARMDKPGTAAGPLKYLIKVGQCIIDRAETHGRERATTGRGRVYDDMG